MAIRAPSGYSISEKFTQPAPDGEERSLPVRLPVGQERRRSAAASRTVM
jgi:hypothetical protein